MKDDDVPKLSLNDLHKKFTIPGLTSHGNSDLENVLVPETKREHFYYNNKNANTVKAFLMAWDAGGRKPLVVEPIGNASSESTRQRLYAGLRWLIDHDREDPLPYAQEISFGIIEGIDGAIIQTKKVVEIKSGLRLSSKRFITYEEIEEAFKTFQASNPMYGNTMGIENIHISKELNTKLKVLAHDIADLGFSVTITKDSVTFLLKDI
jgi:hypothetical protein